LVSLFSLLLLCWFWGKRKSILSLVTCDTYFKGSLPQKVYEENQGTIFWKIAVTDFTEKENIYVFLTQNKSTQPILAADLLLLICRGVCRSQV